MIVQGYTKAFELCVDPSLTVEEFERSWKTMIETYQVQDNETLNSLWEKRMYWVSAYFMQCFFPFLQTTQCSEGFNAVLKWYMSPGNSLLQFAKQYTTLQQKIPGSELHQEANTMLKQPKLLAYLPMERQMSKIYTDNRLRILLDDKTSLLHHDIGDNPTATGTEQKERHT